MPSKPYKKNKPAVKKNNRLYGWVKRNRFDLLVVSILLIICTVVSAINITGYPMRFEDEGTYISQAWAIKEQGTLTHYTYWYDHPPMGWIQMAGHLVTTNAIARYGSAITAGREFMLLLHLLTIVLLFALARRLGIGTIVAGLGALAYGLSPLVVEFSRYVFLDNVALPWLLAAILLALSPRRHLATAIASALCMSIAVLSKETFIVMLPILIYALWTNGDKRNRRFTLTAFMVTFIMVCSLYILYAVLKNELFPGDGHVSLIGTTAWQIFNRKGSGSIFDAASGGRGLVSYWLNIDCWLLLAGVIALPFAFFYRRLRVIAFAFLIGLLLILRTGYLPYPYVIILLPFAALTFAGVIQYVFVEQIKTKKSKLLRWPAGVALVLLIASFMIFVAPIWSTKLSSAITIDQDASSRQAVEWIDQRVSRDNRLVVESAIWTDLQDKGFNSPSPVWLYKTETDPAITKEVGDWQGIDFVVLNGPTLGSPDFKNTFPTVSKAIENAHLVIEFGQDNQKILIYEVKHIQ